MTLLASWRGRLILAFLAVQLLVPLTYFARRDPHDERFAWRMFSPMRMAKCQPRFAIDGKPFALEREFHEAWIELAQRGRFIVVEAMAAHVCDAHPGSAVTVSLDCAYVDRSSASYGGHDMCRTPEL
jgi:hypothetical protein